MKCPHCGNYLPDDSEFCQYCGVKLGVLQPADIPDAETSHIGKSVLPDRLPDIVMNIESKTAAGQSHADDALGKGNDVVASMSTLQRNPTENRRKQIYCKNCGSIIDNATKRCTGCGKQYFRAKLVIPYIAMFALLTLSICMNIMQYIHNEKAVETLATQSSEIKILEEKVSSLNSTVSTQEQTITSQKKEIASLAENAGYFDIISKGLRNANIGYASNNFKSSESIIVLGKNESNRKFTLTANWAQGGNVSVDYSGSAAYISFDKNSWTTSTQMTIKPWKEGVTIATFSNDVDSKTFKILIIVTG